MEWGPDKKLSWPSAAKLKSLFRWSTSSQVCETLQRFLAGFQWTQIPEPSISSGRHSPFKNSS